MGEPLLIRLTRSRPGGPTVRVHLESPLRPGEVTALFGPSGVGKTTTLRCVAGLERIDEGLIQHGSTVWDDGRRRLPPQARRVGLVGQELALFPHLRAWENVAYGRDAGGEARARALLEELGLGRAEADRRPGQLSGGQRQRVALARALASSPAVMLLDEPLSALDASGRDVLRGLLRERLQRLEVPALIVTHDRAEALALADRLVVMVAGAEGGELAQDGAAEAVLLAPRSEAVARALGYENVWTPRHDDAGRAWAGALRLRGEVGAVVVAFAEDLQLTAPGAGDGDATLTERRWEGPTALLRLDAGVPVVARARRAEAEGLSVGQRVGLRLRR
ncbi:ABC transporter ATP-binding protein [Myxococcota bacterium]|nr:ABC transporter ATP-binding protein [Myxococcota bacterium]